MHCIEAGQIYSTCWGGTASPSSCAPTSRAREPSMRSTSPAGTVASSASPRPTSTPRTPGRRGRRRITGYYQTGTLNG
ncbi:hypothetical protein ACFQ3Z_29510 [Streptomyces nogalater]